MTAVLLALLVGCAHRAAGEPDPVSWDFGARIDLDEIRVLPVISLSDPNPVSHAAWVAHVPDARVAARRERTVQLDEIPVELGFAVPGAVAAELGDRWGGRFRAAEWPRAARSEVRDALEGRGSLAGALSRLGPEVGGSATMVLWVDSVHGAPITAEGPPGEVVSTPAGLVLVDADSEPYHVSARVGVAVVTADGEVVLRYVDAYDGILSAARDPSAVGRAIARDVAAQLELVWPSDPRLFAAEPRPTARL